MVTDEIKLYKDNEYPDSFLCILKLFYVKTRPVWFMFDGVEL